ncbi:MAG: galactosyltransferase-domain-containing protein [Benniella sp.]|nr:MAG: galactosyltransferase-domain-containing protein [Benniella sp.]
MPPQRTPIYGGRDVPPQYLKLIRGLQVLGLCPTVWGTYIHLQQAETILYRDARALVTMKSTALDNYVGILWCMLGGLWSFWLTNNLIRRWFIRYEPRSAIIRLFTLAAIFWFVVVVFVSYFGADEPIWPWMAICAILAVAQIIQALHFRFRGIYTIEPHKNPRGVDTRLVILRTVLIPGSIVSFITMMMLLHQNNTLPSSAEMVARTGASTISALNAGKQIIGSAETQILILIVTSWTSKGLQKRRVARETTLLLLPQADSKFSYTYKFIIGEAPNARVREAMGPMIRQEQDQYDDLLILPVSDTYEDMSLKVFSGLEWANKFRFDFLCKTEDDIFVRWDVVARELIELGPTHYYWRGLAFWNIPPSTNPGNKNSDNQFKLSVFPPYVAGSLYIISRDVVTLLTYPGPRFFTKNEEQNMGIWLYPFNIKPIHDKRIQQWDVCENDMLAKHFSDDFVPLESMHDMYENVIKGRSLCQGFRQVHCAACYQCVSRSNPWKDQGFACDDVMGITTVKNVETPYQQQGAVEMMDSMPQISKKDEWILPDLLTDASSIYSDTDDWARLHWAIWTTDSVTAWQTRHFQAIETLFVHNPNAVLIILSNVLPADFFVDYTRQGYQIHVLSFSKELLLKRKWFFNPNTEEWLRDMDSWAEAGKFFPVHLADYLRLVVLYKYGGLYMDLDTLWVRPPGDGMTEFIGADVSDNDGDRTWTLDENTYLANGAMRFQRGRSMFRHIADGCFTVTHYDPASLDCAGPKALTMYVKEHRTALENSGLKILPREAIYPYNWKEIEPALKPSKDADSAIRRVEQHGIGLHLYSKVTSKKPIEEGSVVVAALRIWGLDLFATSALSMPTLQGPKTLIYSITPAVSSPALSPSSSQPFHYGLKNLLLEKQPGAFSGIDAVFVRGTGPSTTIPSGTLVTKRAAVKISVLDGFIAMDPSSPGTRKLDLDLGEKVTTAQLNTVLSRIRYLPPQAGTSGVLEGTDKVTIQVSFGEVRQELVIPVSLV